MAVHNASTTHSQAHPGGAWSLAGVPEDLVRLSVGIENIDDIVADLEQALIAAK
ncbi:PLP-dependent transferase [Nocardioides convexus]|uniref:PLP-dependent transferase n=1 Tax=Nocardioides convexus TaxID=2712224 RepID=UPI003101411C